MEQGTVKTEHVIHTFEPVYDKNSRVLILGTFPSVKSRENCFYYGHPQNRFWKVAGALTGRETPVSIGEKKALLLESGIAIWDVIASCDIRGSSDSSIRNVEPNPIERIVEETGIRHIYGNGDKACRLYDKYCRAAAGLPIGRLPSTSPANAAFSLERLIQEWTVILEGLIIHGISEDNILCNRKMHGAHFVLGD